MRKKQNKKIGLSKYFSKYKIVIALYILFNIVASIMSVLSIVWIAQAVEAITIPDFKLAITNLLIVLGIQVVRRACWLATARIYDIYTAKMMSDINGDLAKQAFKLNSITYTEHDTGTFVQRIVQDPERVINSFANMIDLIADVISSVVMLVYIITLNVYVALVLVGLIIILTTLEYFRLKRKRKLSKIVRNENDQINSLTTEIVRSEKDIKSLDLEDKLSEVSSTRYKNYRRASYNVETSETWFWQSKSFLMEIVGTLLLIFGISLMDKGLLTLASFMIIYSNQNNVYTLIWGVGNIANSIVDIKISSQRMFALFDEVEFKTETFGNKHIDKVIGDIEFKNVSFSYTECDYEYNKKTKKVEKKIKNTNKIFDNLSFKIEHNTTVAFVGKSGSGKSTILNLIAKMMDVDSGEVLIDNVNIKELDKDTLRNSLSLVNQFPYIFDMTIKDNLLLAKKDATDEEIWNALKLSAFDEFVKTLPEGINSKVGESGIKLSGGQKQRLAIARAMLRRSAIILFDESTSSLDNFAQEDVKRSIDSLNGSSTIVIVAHRLSTIKDADKIFFLDEGNIIDSGTFNELYSRNEKFQRMFLAENIDNFSL